MLFILVKDNFDTFLCIDRAKTKANEAGQPSLQDPPAASNEDPQPEKSEEPVKKKRKVIKKKKKKADDETPKPAENVESAQPDAKNDVPESTPDKPEPAAPKDPVQLQGLSNIEKPVDLDKLLLSDQSNGILSKIKKKIKKKKTRKVTTNDETDADNRKDDHTDTGIGDSKEIKLNAGLSNSNESKTGKNASSEDGGTRDASSRLGATTPISELSGKKELRELSNVRGRSTPKKLHKSSRASVISGGDVDVNSYIKNMKQIEDEKNQAKRELLNKTKKKRKVKAS